MTPAAATPPTVHDALARASTELAAAGVPEPRADAEVLLAHALGTDRTGLVVRAREPVTAPAETRFAALVARRATREPVAYIVGAREFWSLAIEVDRRVLIPRPETELVVATALRLAPRARRVLDVGTGSGAIAIALARELAGTQVVASDVTAPALAVAAGNRSRLAPRVGLVRGDLLRPFRAAAFDLVVSNPPYCVPGTVVQADVRDWEPATALYGGTDGLAALRALVDEAPRVLAAGGWLVVETGLGQASALAARAAESGRYDRVEIARDLVDIERVVAMRTSGASRGEGTWTRS